LPHDLGALLRKPFPVPVGFIGGTHSEELRQAGLDATRRLVGRNLVMVEGGHLYPMESPRVAAYETSRMIRCLLGEPDK
jgi:hypothetical protein